MFRIIEIKAFTSKYGSKAHFSLSDIDFISSVYLEKDDTYFLNLRKTLEDKSLNVPEVIAKYTLTVDNGKSNLFSDMPIYINKRDKEPIIQNAISVNKKIQKNSQATFVIKMTKQMIDFLETNKTDSDVKTFNEYLLNYLNFNFLIIE